METTEVLEGHGDSITGLDVSKDLGWNPGCSQFVKRPELITTFVAGGQGHFHEIARMGTSWRPIPWTTRSAFGTFGPSLAKGLGVPGRRQKRGPKNYDISSRHVFCKL